MGSIAIDAEAVNTADKSTMDQYLAGLPSKNFEPLWSRMNAMVPPTPNPVARPHLWKYSSSLPDLETAARLVPEEQAERRVLMLVNPSLRKSYLCFFRGFGY